MAESNRKDWRELCAAVAKEPDSEKVVRLVQQILRALDEHDQSVKFASSPKPYCGQS